MIENKLQLHRQLWEKGRNLIFQENPAAKPHGFTYRETYDSPEKMWQTEITNTLVCDNYPTDGIPTVRPNLGVVFIPAIAGQTVRFLNDKDMPWPGEHLSKDQIRQIPELDINVDLMRKAIEFYAFAAKGSPALYHPDTQGPFDIAHIIYGDQIMFDFYDDPQWVEELLGICTDLIIRVTDKLKELIGVPDNSMIHGHGTPQGLYFPGAGCRSSHDSDTLMSSEQIEQFSLPFLRRLAKRYSGAFIHYCGKHEELFKMLCSEQLVKAIDLGNPESYDLDFLMRTCAETDTVLYSRLPVMEQESGYDYVTRIARKAKDFGTRLVLRSRHLSESRDEAQELYEIFHSIS